MMTADPPSSAVIACCSFCLKPSTRVAKLGGQCSAEGGGHVEDPSDAGWPAHRQRGRRQVAAGPGFMKRRVMTGLVLWVLPGR